MKYLLWVIIGAVLLFYYVRYIEYRSVYFPLKEITVTPDNAGLPYEEVFFMTSDNKKLNGWFIPNDKTDFVVLIFHGNAGNISHRLPKISMLYDLGYSVFVFDYRGYGKSEGRPSESGFYEDAIAAYKYLNEDKRFPAENIIFYGASIGGAVGIDLAQKVKAKALITEDTFTSISDMARITYPFIPKFFISTKFDSISKIKNVDCPKLIIHSADDEMIPFAMGKKLYEEAAEPKEFLEISGFHNEAYFLSEEQIKNGIQSFIKEN